MDDYLFIVMAKLKADRLRLAQTASAEAQASPRAVPMATDEPRPAQPASFESIESADWSLTSR
jgi:hypothetical protein